MVGDIAIESVEVPGMGRPAGYYNVALARARALVTGLEEEPHLNLNTGTKEFAIRDPDGYYVMVSALDPV